MLDDANEYQIIDLKNPVSCFDKLYPWERDHCLMWEAAYHKDSKYCNFTEDNTRKVFCYNLVAVYSKNKVYCNQSEIPKYCDVEIDAIKTNNPKLCESVEIPRKCYGYIGYVFGDWNLCPYSSNTPQCYMNIVQKNDDIKSCKAIVGDNSFCYSYFAIKQKKADLCDESNQPQNCYYTAAVGLLNISLCDNTKDRDFCLGHTIIPHAITYNNISECATAGSWKENCIEEFALLRDDAELCKKTIVGDMCLDALKKNRESKENKLRFLRIRKA